MQEIALSIAHIREGPINRALGESHREITIYEIQRFKDIYKQRERERLQYKIHKIRVCMCYVYIYIYIRLTSSTSCVNENKLHLEIGPSAID